MPGINATGLAQTDDYNLGRGTVYFSLLDPTSKVPIGYRDLGNAPEFSIAVETETLEHQSSRAGLKVTDKEVLISQKVTLSLTLDEINFQNLATLLSGTSHDHVGPSPATENGSILGTDGDGTLITAWVAAANNTLGQWYDLTADANGAGLRCYDIDVTKLTVATEGGSAYAIDSDYIVDTEMGRIFLLTGGTIDASKGIDLTLVGVDDGTRRIDEVRALGVVAATGALKFISENPANADKQTEYQFHSVSLKAEGDFSLIGDEFTQMQFTAVAEVVGGTVSPDSPTLTIRTLNTFTNPA